MSFSVVMNADEFVLSAVQQVLDDFQINSSESTAAQQVTSTFIEWARVANNKGKVKEFCDDIIRSLETVFIVWCLMVSIWQYRYRADQSTKLCTVIP